jgi:hypothetical protein
MDCQICGDNKEVAYRPSSKQALCPTCAKETPRKVTRAEFDKQYWDKDAEVPESTRREFYSDYLSSTNTLPEYIKATTSNID